MRRNEAPHFGRLGNEKGKRAEIWVKSVIVERIETGNVPAWLSGYEKSTPKDDAKGIDGWFITDVGKIPIQIKSGTRQRKQFVEERPDIPVVIVHLGLSPDLIYARCISAISPARRKYLEQRK